MTVPEVLPMPENLAESPRPYFNPRLPDGRRRGLMLNDGRSPAFQSMPPGWEATGIRPDRLAWLPISIHASRMGGDL